MSSPVRNVLAYWHTGRDDIMTHSGGKPHAVGDRGQRYEVSVLDPLSSKRHVLGWTDSKETADGMCAAMKKHPSWKDPEVKDRQA